MSNQNLHIVKLSGKVLNEPEPVIKAILKWQESGDKVILVHGGGIQATRISKAMNIKPKVVEGRRITDSDTLDVAIMVFGGLLNKKLTAQLNARGIESVGVSGGDLSLISSHKRPIKEIDYGWVGDIDKVNMSNFEKLLNCHWVPVVCSLTVDKTGQLLNTNADTIATQIGISMHEEYKSCIYFISDIPGVMRDLSDDESLIKELIKSEYESLKREGIISGGMIPKLDNAFEAIASGVYEIWIGNDLGKEEVGTWIK
jgi:acetylglutamate kinase